MDKTKTRSVFFSVYDEFLRFKQELCYLAAFLNGADKLAMCASLIMIFGVVLPWISIPGHLTHTGLMGGGDIHLILAIATMVQVRSVPKYHIKALRKKGYLAILPLRLRRAAFHYILLGVLSTLFAIAILLYLGAQHAAINNIVDIRLGFYITTFAGLALVFCGIARLKAIT